jgi:hypothetical protein
MFQRELSLKKKAASSYKMPVILFFDTLLKGDPAGEVSKFFPQHKYLLPLQHSASGLTLKKEGNK